MYREGTIVTLSIDKEHFDGQDTLKLKQGTCGMVVAIRSTAHDGNHTYVVDFGAYGQWNCYHNELNGDDPDGWDNSARRPEVATSARYEGTIDIGSGELAVMWDDVEAPVIDFEKDLERRMKEIEKGN
jgi:hypothetical protein